MQSHPPRSSLERGRTVQARGRDAMACGRGERWQGYGSNSNLPGGMCSGTGSYCIKVPAASGAGFMRSKISRISRFVSRRPWQMEARPQDSHRKPARSSSDPTPPLSLAAIRGVSYHRPFGPSKSNRVVILTSGQSHLRRDPHACCSPAPP